VNPAVCGTVRYFLINHKGDRSARFLVDFRAVKLNLFIVVSLPLRKCLTKLEMKSPKSTALWFLKQDTTVFLLRKIHANIQHSVRRTSIWNLPDCLKDIKMRDQCLLMHSHILFTGILQHTDDFTLTT